MNMLMRTSVKFLCALLMIYCHTSTAASSKRRQRAPRVCVPPVLPIKGAVILDMASSGTISYFTPEFVRKSLEVYGAESLVKANGKTIVGTFELKGYRDKKHKKTVSSDGQMNELKRNLCAAARLMNLAQITIYRYKADAQAYKLEQKEIFFNEKLPEHPDEIKPEFFCEN